MIILGIDPGYAITGFGLIQVEKQKLTALDYGVIRTDAEVPFPERLLAIDQALDELRARYKPDCFAVEELFFSRNTTTAMGTAQARGVAIVAAARAGLLVYEYTPVQVKAAVTGYGRADKKQMQEMVRVLLKLRQIPRPDDAADALAVAICHAHSGNRDGRLAVGGYQ
ncbi:MAG: crossover junction endodeoxyribonuclease RuvC [Saccharofermentanales bacterium]